MFVSLRKPYSCYGRPADCCGCGPSRSVNTVDAGLPVMLKQLEELSKQIFRERDATVAVEPEMKPTNFNLKLAMKNFRPEDIKVNVNGDKLIVEAKREDKEEEEGSYSYHLREVKRTYPIPEGVDKMKLTSAFTGNGVLEIEAPLLPVEEETSPETTDIEVVHENETKSKLRSLFHSSLM